MIKSFYVTFNPKEATNEDSEVNIYLNSRLHGHSLVSNGNWGSDSNRSNGGGSNWGDGYSGGARGVCSRSRAVC